MAVASLLKDVFVGVGKTIIGALTFNPAMFASGVAQTGAAVKKMMDGGVSKTFNAAYSKQMAMNKGGVAIGKSGLAGMPGLGNAVPSKNTSVGGNQYAFTINMPVGSTQDTVSALKKVIMDTVKEHDKNKLRVAYQ